MRILVYAPGLQSIMACAAPGLLLHGKSKAQQGIPEGYPPVQELDKCKAGGPPRPCQSLMRWSFVGEPKLHRQRSLRKGEKANAEEIAKAEQAATEAEADATARRDSCPACRNIHR